MRGKDVSATDAKTKAGITPAYAGKRRKRPTGKRLEGDHPRLCGEKLGFKKWVSAYRGSPPPMRGKVIRSEPR